ncbi:Dps family protein [Halomonas sp. CUBES01]|uniref:DNA starvation/stationary phase protection protein n=1 Tax=Vreelandella gomseomensis TaxID=370766 RepID=A0ABU1GE09_9GAMM|nr:MULTISPECIES: Dps family protein [Halomonas]MDR5875724.1 DNA starvation/stationary phase protection protein [Halomonas gomseomensis]MEC4768739.1 Dps family protein [Halomonas sp. CUBES01]
MSNTNHIGLNEVSASELAQKLNELLANYQVFYMNVRGYHWNIKGRQFFQLHEKFEEFYTDLLAKVDEVAERILTLGHYPIHAYSNYIDVAKIQEDKDVQDGEACVRGILQGYQALIELQREILSLASNAGDEGTAAQVGDYIREQEKTVWMLTSYLD